MFHGYDDIAFLVPFFNIPVCFDYLLQCIFPIYQGLESPLFYETFDQQQASSDV